MMTKKKGFKATILTIQKGGGGRNPENTQQQSNILCNEEPFEMKKYGK